MNSLKLCRVELYRRERSLCSVALHLLEAFRFTSMFRAEFQTALSSKVASF